MGGRQPLSAAATCAIALTGVSLALPAVAFAQDAQSRPAAGAASEVEAMRGELAQARAQIVEQERKLAEQQRRLDLLEQRLSGLAQTTQQIRNEVASAPVAGSAATVAEDSKAIRVGEPPKDSDRPPTVAVLDQQGSVVTRKGQLIGEVGFDYTRSDRNRAIFRGITFPEAVLIGVFDINESRQDILTGSVAMRYGITDRLEIGARVPYLYRADTLISAPVAQQGNEDFTVNSSTRGSGLGDVEVSARYQINNGGRNRPFLIANIQGMIPTGRDPYSVRRSITGAALQSSTGAGYMSVTPGLTAILPSEPAVLFGTIAYTYNFGRNVDTRLGGIQIDRIKAGNQITFGGGIGLALNDRTSMNFGYSHAWAFGTRTTFRGVREGGQFGPSQNTISRDLQIGRLLIGVSQKFSPKLQVNWSFEVGATDDAPDVRTSLRIPIRF